MACECGGFVGSNGLAMVMSVMLLMVMVFYVDGGICDDVDVSGFGDGEVGDVNFDGNVLVMWIAMLVI